jgi:hypothetical protein
VLVCCQTRTASRRWWRWCAPFDGGAENSSARPVEVRCGLTACNLRPARVVHRLPFARSPRMCGQACAPLCSLKCLVGCVPPRPRRAGSGLSALSAALLLLEAERDLVSDELSMLNAKRAEKVTLPDETDSEAEGTGATGAAASAKPAAAARSSADSEVGALAVCVSVVDSGCSL